MSLLKKLKIVSLFSTPVYAHGRSNGKIVKALLDEGKVEFDSGRNNAMFGEHITKESIKKDRLWSAYENGFDVKIVFDKVIKIEVTKYDCNRVDGHKEKKEWIATFLGMKAKDLIHFKSEIERQFNYYATRLFEDEQEAKMNKRIEEIKKELLK